jgi:hypothetical protein
MLQNNFKKQLEQGPVQRRFPTIRRNNIEMAEEKEEEKELKKEGNSWNEHTLTGS